MALNPPSHIPVAVLEAAPVRHAWDDYDPYKPIGKSEEPTMQALERLTDRAIIAYAAACAEWVVWRFRKLLPDPAPLNFLEACWAFEMDKGIQAPRPLKGEEWRGPIRGAVDLALVSVLNTYYTTESGAGHVEGAFGEKVARHVLPNPDVFLAWRKTALDRLQKHFPRKPEDVWGPPVPRETFDPSKTLTAESIDGYARDFLAGLPFDRNPLLKRTGGDNSK